MENKIGKEFVLFAILMVFSLGTVIAQISSNDTLIENDTLNLTTVNDTLNLTTVNDTLNATNPFANATGRFPRP
jgi:hypothetical protein